MNGDIDVIELIKRTQLGEHGSADRLAEVARQRLFPYIYRLTLDHDLTQDLLQETLLKMVETLKDLRQPDRFWHWLFRTALGTVQHHYRERARTEAAKFSAFSKERLSEHLSGNHDDGLSYVMRKELSETIVDGIAQLDLSYRNVLALRCYEQLSFAQIGNLMGCKELRARVLFFRAKRALSHRLSRRGFGKNLLLTALGLFEVLTSPKEGAAACTVNAASMNVGLIGSLAGAAGTPSGIALVVTAAGFTYTLTLEHFIYVIAFGVFTLVCFIIALYWE